MKTAFFFFALLLAGIVATGQPAPPRADCGTPPPTPDKRLPPGALDQTRQKAALPICVRVVVTVFADNNGTNRAATDANVRRQFANMANQFAQHTICFILQDIRQVNNTDLNDQVDSTEQAEVFPFRVANVLNIFVHNTLPGLNGTAYGVVNYNAYLSLSGATIADPDNVSTMGHEVGHVFGLSHTHDDANGLENVARSGSCVNCERHGDAICDTPADPNQHTIPGGTDYLSDNTSVGCVYTGTYSDACGVIYTPSVVNMMAYGRRPCRNQFTNDQGFTMRFWLGGSPFAYIIEADEMVTTPLFGTVNRSSGSYIDSARDQINVAQIGTFTVTGTTNQLFQAKRIIWKPGARFTPGLLGRTRATANPYCQ